MRIGIITDAHANLPALEAALAALDDAGCELIVHCGDAIGIGPHPRECLERLLALPNIQFVIGNHDEWLAFGLPDPRPDWMSEGEFEHQVWTHAQIPGHLRRKVAAWPYAIEIPIGNGTILRCSHYAASSSGTGFASIVREPVAADLDRLFANVAADLVFYGHHHPSSDLRGQRRYVNPGALGCHVPEARFAIVTADGEVTLGAVPYDWSEVLADFDRRYVPERDVIRRIFFGQP